MLFLLSPPPFPLLFPIFFPSLVYSISNPSRSNNNTHTLNAAVPNNMCLTTAAVSLQTRFCCLVWMLSKISVEAILVLSVEIGFVYQGKKVVCLLFSSTQTHRHKNISVFTREQFPSDFEAWSANSAASCRICL